MRDFLLKFRILLEGVLLWLGEVGLFFIIAMYCYSPIATRFGKSGGIAFYAVLVFGGFVTAFWILIERRKELNEKISTGTYIFLNVLPFLATGIFIISYISLLD